MTREDSRKETVKILRKAKTGKEISDALLAHFKSFSIPENKTPSQMEDVLATLSSPLFGLER